MTAKVVRLRNKADKREAFICVMPYDALAPHQATRA